MNFGIRTRIVSAAIVVLLVFGGINFATSRAIFRQELVNSLLDQARVISRNLALQLDRAMTSGVVEGTLDFGMRCEDAIARYEMISHAMVVSTEGRIMYHNDSNQQGRSISDPNLLEAIRKPVETTLTYNQQEEAYYAAVVPVFDVQDRHLAAIVVDFSDGIVEQRLQSVSLYSALAFIAALVLIALIMAAVLSAGVARPLTRLLDAVRASAQGGSLIPAQVVRSSRDEIGQLNVAVSQLAERAQTLIDDSEQRLAASRAESERWLVYLGVVAGIFQAAGSAPDLDVLLSQVANLLAKRFNFYHVGLFLFDDAGEWAVLRAAAGTVGRQRLARGYRVPVGFGSTVGYVAEWGVTRIASNAEVEALLLSNPDLPTMRSEIALPLRTHTRVMGVLDIYSTIPDAFSNEESAQLQTLADQVSMAINNVQLSQQIQAHLDAERHAYGELSYQAWKELLPTRSDLSYVSDRQGVSSGVASWEPQMERALSAGEIASGGVRDSALAIPIKVRGHTIGVVDAQKSEQSGWTAEETVLMQSLIEQLGTAIESARLYQDTQRRATRERTIAEVTGQIRASLELEDVLHAAASEIREAMGLERIVVRLAVPETAQNKE
ncbi:MAG: GAF domain-containing protein [Anaerolineae bacterium]|nr:GAF domain-containing protein [Anaerolineae bacterium]